MEKDWSIIFKCFRLEKLTKKLLIGLEEGCYIESNIDYIYKDENGQYQAKPRFGEYVLPMAQREEQWKRMVMLSANNRLCRIYNKKSGQ